MPVQLPPTATINILERADKSSLSSSSSHSSDSCDHNSSAECEKPVSTDSLAIGLGVGIPAAVTLLVLGFFLFRNYRKDKKESLEHDPDFDENGEATALPDFPQMEQNPFNAGLPKPKFNKSNTSLSGHSTMKDDPYLDNFVLPYHHQTGSKLSLDEYARNLGSNPGFSASERGSAYMNPGIHSRTRNSSLSNIQQPSAQVSPQKSNLKSSYTNTQSTSPLKTRTMRDEKYTNLPNESVVSHTNDYYSNSNTLNETSTSDDSKHQNEDKLSEKFSVNYENESSDLPLNKSLNQSNNSFNTTREEFGAADQPGKLASASVPVVESPFEDKFDVNKTPFQEKLENREVSPESEFESSIKGVEHESADYGDGFDFSNSTTNDATTETTPASQASNLGAPDNGHRRNKSPRISAFNLLKNDSDDEDAPFEDSIEGTPLSPEQDEELRRMKSVYKVYFDRENSTRKPNEDNLEARYKFQPDPNMPLPEKDMDYLRINNELKTDTDYHKRLTTTSSIYNEDPIFSHEDQQYYDQHVAPHQQFYQSPSQHQQPHPNYQQQQQQHQIYHNYQQAPPPPVALPPLQTLPSASEIRKSTIQTYTDYQPRSKNQVTSPTAGKQPFNPIENDGVWTSPASSSQPSFHPQQPHGGYAPPLNNGSSSSVIPSPTQVARSSVVMLNPVTEITKQRKFKPAGSLAVNPRAAPSPTMMQSNGSLPSPNSYSQSQFNNESNHDNDLIPGSRNDVRRMMNTNF